MQICNKGLTSLQRRSMQKVGATVALAGAANILVRAARDHGQPVLPVALGVAAVSLLPVVFAIWVTGRYLAEEPDEFMRAIAVRALLWGIVVTMTGDAIAGVLTEVYGGRLPLGLLNVDLFFVGTGVAFRLLLRSYR